MKNIAKKDNLIELRKLLHSKAELSDNEINTSKIINDFIKIHDPDEIISFKYGSAFVFDSGNAGLTVVFRADMDGLPIHEENDHDHVSMNDNVSHACGHDGHMAILCGLAEKISADKPDKGKVVLLFQHAEETGEGARYIADHINFRELKPDHIFGLHNIPGYKKGKIIFKNDNFTSASRGIVLELIGKTSHASEPEKGINPVFAIKKLIESLYEIPKDPCFKGFALITFVYIKLGEIAFGTSPGYAEIMITVRSELNVEMDLVVEKIEEKINNITTEEKLKYKISYKEIFPVVHNDNLSNKLIVDAAKKNNFSIEELTDPFKWSEDFSYYTNNFRGGYFGIGSGLDHPGLHNSDYDFPDDIINIGVEMFYQIYKLTLKN
ncbi:MAG: amidohydrolase [Candidatus Delongbacteria bacterium]|nr:amidohydrolase [Candidatus Delongbacteria bacterium]